MKGTRPLTNEEILKVAEIFDGTFAVRNRSLFMLGVSIGGRISEMLSLKVGDVYQHHRSVTDIQFDKSIVKGGDISRTVPMNIDARDAVADLILWLDEKFSITAMADDIMADFPLFPSRNAGNGVQPMKRQQADKMLRLAFQNAGLNGKLATHSLRKSFAQRLYDQTGDIFAVQQMLGHQSVATTQDYLGVNYRSVREAVEAMALANTSKLDTTPLYKATDDQLMAEIVNRGYKVSK